MQRNCHYCNNPMLHERRVTNKHRTTMSGQGPVPGPVTVGMYNPKTSDERLGLDDNVITEPPTRELIPGNCLLGLNRVGMKIQTSAQPIPEPAMSRYGSEHPWRCSSSVISIVVVVVGRRPMSSETDSSTLLVFLRIRALIGKNNTSMDCASRASHSPSQSFFPQCGGTIGGRPLHSVYPGSPRN